MSRIFKKRGTRSLPEGATIINRRGRRVAQWVDGRGAKREAEVIERDGASCIVIETTTWFMRWRGHDGVVREASTQCRDRDMAARVLAEAEAREERIAAGILSASECAMSAYADRPLSEHFSDFLDSLCSAGRTTDYVADCRHVLTNVAAACSFARLRNLDRGVLEKHLAELRRGGLSARTSNRYGGVWVSFGNWLVRVSRMASNPFDGLSKANERVDRRRNRRALSPDELERLIEAARVRPLHEFQHGNRDARPAKVSETTRQRLESIGNERAFMYATLAATGLRYSELRSIRCSQVVLNADQPHIVLYARDEKARRGAQIPLQSALAAELARHIERKRSNVVGHSDASGNMLAFRQDDDPRLFDMPEKGVREFNKDLAFAGILKHDARGRTLDLHCLRHTFCTWLAQSGVSLQVAQRLMRHSDPKLTTAHYTHLGLLDLGAAVEKLPYLSTRKTAAAAAENDGRNLPPSIPLADGFSVQSGAILCKEDTGNEQSVSVLSYDQKAAELRGKPRSFGDSKAGRSWYRGRDLNPGPLDPQSSALTN